MGFTLGVDLAGRRPVMAISGPDGPVPAPPSLPDPPLDTLLHTPLDDALDIPDSRSQDALVDLLERLGIPDAPHSDRTPSHVEVAALVERCVRAAAGTQGTRPDAVVVSHPAAWGPYRTDLLDGALADRDLPPCVLVPDASAIVRHATSSGRLRLPGPAHVAVLDVREEHTTVAVVSTPGAASDEASQEALGQVPALVGPVRVLTDLGAADLDDAVLAHVRGVVGVEDGAELDRDAAAALRAVCRHAADALLDGTAAVVLYPAPEGTRDVRVVPADIEPRLRPRGVRTVGEAAAAVAAVAPAGVDAVLLTGRLAALPLLTELVTQRFDAPVTALPGDAEAAALGAAATPTGPFPQPTATRGRRRAGAPDGDGDSPRHRRPRAWAGRRGRGRPVRATAVAWLGVVVLGVLAGAGDASATDDAARRPAHEVVDDWPRTGASGG